MQQGSGTSTPQGHIVTSGQVTCTAGGPAKFWRLNKDGSFHVVATFRRDATDVGNAAFTCHLNRRFPWGTERCTPDVVVPAAAAGTVTRVVWEHVAYPFVILSVSVDGAEPGPVVFSYVDLTATPT